MPQPLKIWVQAHWILRLLLASIAWICFVLQKLYRHIHVKPRSWSQSYLQNIRKKLDQYVMYWNSGSMGPSPGYYKNKTATIFFANVFSLGWKIKDSDLAHFLGGWKFCPKNILNMYSEFILIFLNGKMIQQSLKVFDVETPHPNKKCGFLKKSFIMLHLPIQKW